MSSSRVWRAVAVLFVVFLLHAPAHAQRKHTVQQGQTLGAIAKRYRVSVTNLAAANRLKKTSNLRVGQVLRIPPKGVVYVYPGQTLTGIAQLNKVSVKALARANRLKPTATLRVGQRLQLPGYSAQAKASKARNTVLNGLVTLERPASKETLRVRLFDKAGKPEPKARQRLARFLRDRENDEGRRPHVRLMRVLSYVADHFNGRTIIVVSAYRSVGNGNNGASRHASGQAIDIRVEGVPNEVLRDYCLTLSKVGVGYYPRSSFIHVDVRSKAVYWVDWSRPGEPPLYLPPGETPEKYDAGASTAVSPTSL
ncbi:MAG: LysM peptidoglycan-binding domain-containing protein [Myxococcales bacterium]|nr:MAG: LysM peptidoglycan-binding domain-containing protein [Myxococcales bacterium]